MAEHSPAVTLRLARDHERFRLAKLDFADGGDRLLRWTLKFWHGIDYFDLPIFTKSKLAEPEKGSWPMAKKSETKSTVAKELSEALAFVSVACNKDDLPWQEHIVFHNNYVIATNGQISAGHPVAESLTCCPQFDRLRAAINKCKSSLSIAELQSGKLSIAGDKLRALVDCLPIDQFPFTAPDAIATKPDGEPALLDDRLKFAFSVCGQVVSENGIRMVECSLLLENNICTATNGKVLIQYKHGIELPPNLIVPKLFASLVCKVKSPLYAFGFEPGRSITFHFENGAWLKTLLYEDKYPEVSVILDNPSNPKPITPEFFDAIETVAGFNPQGVAIVKKGKITSHETDDAGAQFELEGVEAGLCFDGEQAKSISGATTSIDMTTYPDRAFFFGDNMRGVILGVRLLKEDKGLNAYVDPDGYQKEPEHIPRDENDDDIPF